MKNFWKNFWKDASTWDRVFFAAFAIMLFLSFIGIISIGETSGRYM